MGFRRKINFGSLTKSSKNTNKAIVVMRKEELNGISNARYLSTKSTTSGNVPLPANLDCILTIASYIFIN